MSFGFGVGDFVAVGNLTLKLYRVFKSAQGEFKEISAQLSSFYIVIDDLKEQAADPDSLLHRHGRSDLIGLVNNLHTTLRELEDLYNKYKRMGRNAADRIEFGLANLSALRKKLTIHIGLINQYTSSLTLGAVGRMETRLAKILAILQEDVRQGSRRARMIVSASEADPQAWELLETQLQTEGIEIEYLQENRDEIRSLVSQVVEDMNNWEIATEILDLQRNIDTDVAEAHHPIQEPAPILGGRDNRFHPGYNRQPPMAYPALGIPEPQSGGSESDSLTVVELGSRIPGPYYEREPPSPDKNCFQVYCDVCCGCDRFTTRDILRLIVPY